MRVFGVVVISCLLGACQWVKPTEGATEVALVKRAHVQSCEKLGNTVATTKEGLGIVKRKDKQVTEDLIGLAKNDAAKMGGDTIVSNSEAKDGQMEFEIYKCAQ